MPASETLQKRFFPAMYFGCRYIQPCLGADCHNGLDIDPLTEGAIWACVKCRRRHEFYIEFAAGPGGRLKYGVVRLLEGLHERVSGEPDIAEFVE